MFIEIEEKAGILVIDPNPALRGQLDLMFNGDAQASLSANAANLPYFIHICEDCSAAKHSIETSLANDSPYRLAFIDNQFEHHVGLTLISELWQIDPDLQVVLCNGDSDLSWQQISETLGESDQLLILEKPFSDLELRQIVHAMMRKWQLSKQSQNVMQYMEQQIQQRTAEIAEKQRQLLQAEKMAAIGQLAAGIAHEINTPAQYIGDNISALGDFFQSLNDVIVFYRQLIEDTGSDVMLQRVSEQERQQDLAFILEDTPVAIAQSKEGIEQIVHIVQAMKGFSHIGQNKSMVNINQALENVLIVAKSSYKYIADIVLQLGEIPNIECIVGELNQAFLNIIINAAHAIEDSKKGRGTITLSTVAYQGGIEVRISDTGNGIPEAIRDRIYDPFFTTKEVGRGTGQGLNIAFRIINEQHGGKLSFISEIGQGTTFIIHLPRFLKVS